MSAVVIEGVDGTGKTTLARWFESRGFRYQHFGVPRAGEDVFKTYLKALRKARTEDIVFDRLHLGEIAYGLVMRGSTKLAVEELKILNRELFASEGLLILCSVPEDIRLANLKSDEYTRDVDKLRRIEDIYKRLNRELGCLSYYNYTAMNENVFEPYASRIRRRLVSYATGNYGATHLFVGEKPVDKISVPFSSMRNSSGVINRSLWAAGYKECDFAIVNALNLSGKEQNIGAVLQSAPNVQRVIALGQIAERVCNHQGIRVNRVPHPQFIRRFEAKNHEGYVELLENLRLK